MRIVAGIEYDGSAYHGWQKQRSPPLATLQMQCEAALSRVAAQPITVTCAGRTDKGVHAVGQVIHFDTHAQRNMHAWVAGSNHYLPNNMRLLWAKLVDDSFHARYSALSRRYQYILYNHPLRPALLRQRVSWWPIPLDITKMAAATHHLLGEHDFSAFRGADCQAKTTRRHIDHLQLIQREHFILVDIQANAFLHHMVRNIVGVLIAIGQGERQPSWAQEVLLSRQRSQAAMTAPADGLYLTQVRYPSQWDLPHLSRLMLF